MIPAAPDLNILVDLKDVERELARQMKLLQGEGEEPVHRARMSNLVIFCNSQSGADAVQTMIPGIVAVHPARVLLLVGEPGNGTNELTATICVRPQRIGSKQQAVTEQVTLHARGGRIERLPFAVRALLIGDLPINVWWSANVPPPMAGPLLLELAENASQIIYDSIGWVDPARGMAATASWAEQIERGGAGGRWRVTSDLNWRRLKYWRKLVAQALDEASAPGAAESICEVLIEHGPHAFIQGWELASWLAQRYGWQLLTGRVQPGSEISWRFHAGKNEVKVRIKRLEEAGPDLRRVRIACKLDGKPGAMNLVNESSNRLAIQLEGVEAAPRTVIVPPRTPAELVGRQLSDRERDPVFHQSLAVAQILAKSVLR